MPRQKYVYPTDQVAHLWANKVQESARNPRRNFYYDGDTIYSYGRHFPIARHVTGADGRAAILLTTRTYSNTTAGHISEVWQSIPHEYRPDRVFHVWDPSNHPHTQLEHYRSDVEDLIRFMRKKGIRKHTRLRHYEEACERSDEAARFALFFGCEWTPPDLGVTDDELADWQQAKQEWDDGAQARYDAARKRADARWAARSERWRKENEERRKRAEEYELRKESFRAQAPLDWEAWKLGGPTTEAMRLHPPTYQLGRLLEHGESVETSMGVMIPREQAVLFVRYLLRLYATATLPFTVDRDDPSFMVAGHYRFSGIDEAGVVTVGCHKFERAEVERWAVVLGIRPADSNSESESTSSTGNETEV